MFLSVRITGEISPQRPQAKPIGSRRPSCAVQSADFSNISPPTGSNTISTPRPWAGVVHRLHPVAVAGRVVDGDIGPQLTAESGLLGPAGGGDHLGAQRLG